MPVQKTWTRIRPLFKREFPTISDDKLIVDSLANLAHRLNKILGSSFLTWKNTFTCWKKTTPPIMSSQTGELNSKEVAIQRMLLPPPSMTQSNHIPNFCWHKFFVLQHPNMPEDYFLTRIKHDLQWMTRTEFSSPSTESKPTRKTMPYIPLTRSNHLR